MKRLIIIPLICLLSGCPGGRPAPEIGYTYINGERLCFSVNKKDVLNYYRIESDQEEGYSVIKHDSNLNLSYPDDCINIKWEYGYSYAISYGLNGKHYIHEFFINNNGQLRELR
ncbi:putative T6SS immunity periplasmic lipoprotein [Lelliottia sp. JS-SCA-14]|uniref:putative T6SS immunity periplasmic lipoprotein n=1 Tax=Lelliottia sp. JS-SCA-14 TaxID=3110110 RepID=UPI002D786C52|nr:putative T6SS immunity periplasmic lipoprotein [Lelliottia sp. JS-SCA-14]